MLLKICDFLDAGILLVCTTCLSDVVALTGTVDTSLVLLLAGSVSLLAGRICSVASSFLATLLSG